jgi:D-beta-D-heptose 7-phosphate kinase / D-beta-D-heptose 1-phosphate adenosyltransferase
VTILQPLGSFADVEVLVIGDAMLDSYLLGSSDRLCQEAPVPIVSVGERETSAGGAANVAVNVRALGGRATFVSVTGVDPAARSLRERLDEADVDDGHVFGDPSRETLSKARILSGGHLLLRLDHGTTTGLSDRSERAVIEALRQAWDRCRAVVVSDYGYGTMTPAVIDAVRSLQASDPRALVVDAKDLARYRDAHPTITKPNYAQAIGLLDGRMLADGRAEQIDRLGERLLDATGADVVAVTLDADGALAFERGRASYRTYARPVRAASTSGAGDAFAAAVALSAGAGVSMPASIELGSAASAVVTGKERSSVCSAAELRQHVSGEHKIAAGEREAADRIEFLRRQGSRIVFTNGCFDLLHRGHVTYLSRAKSLGDVLIVGVNTDEGVRSLKGPDRPITPLEDRLEVLAALSCVDVVVPFGEPTPERLIESVRPDVFVKGGDYTVEMLPEAALVERLGGTVNILPYVDDRSTTRLVRRIRAEPQRADAV